MDYFTESLHLPCKLKAIPVFIGILRKTESQWVEVDVHTMCQSGAGGGWRNGEQLFNEYRVPFGVKKCFGTG